MPGSAAGTMNSSITTFASAAWTVIARPKDRAAPNEHSSSFMASSLDLDGGFADHARALQRLATDALGKFLRRARHRREAEPDVGRAAGGIRHDDAHGARATTNQPALLSAQYTPRPRKADYARCEGEGLSSPR